MLSTRVRASRTIPVPSRPRTTSSPVTSPIISTAGTVRPTVDRHAPRQRFTVRWSSLRCAARRAETPLRGEDDHGDQEAAERQRGVRLHEAAVEDRPERLRQQHDRQDRRHQQDDVPPHGRPALAGRAGRPACGMSSGRSPGSTKKPPVPARLDSQEDAVEHHRAQRERDRLAGVQRPRRRRGRELRQHQRDHRERDDHDQVRQRRRAGCTTARGAAARRSAGQPDHAVQHDHHAPRTSCPGRRPGFASPPSITALISPTSIVTIESVRIRVPSGSPSASARCSARSITPNAHQNITKMTHVNVRPASQSGPGSQESPRPSASAAATVPHARTSRAAPGLRISACATRCSRRRSSGGSGRWPGPPRPRRAHARPRGGRGRWRSPPSRSPRPCRTR